MPGQRKRHNSAKSETKEKKMIQKNRNDNHSAERVKTCSTSKEVDQASDESQNDKVQVEVNEETVRATFHEDDEVVDMEIEGHDNVSSDDEADSESDDEEGLLHDDEKPSEDEETVPEEQNIESEDEKAERRKYKRQRKMERCEKRASIEQKIDTLSSSILAMQEIMTQQGFSTRTRHKGRSSTESDDESQATIYKNAVPQLVRDEQPQITNPGGHVLVDP